MDWDHLANLLKSELKKRGVTYEQLHDKLSSMGINGTVNNINRKINRGSFQFIFFLQCAAAIGIKNIHLDELLTIENE